MTVTCLLIVYGLFTVLRNCGLQKLWMKRIIVLLRVPVVASFPGMDSVFWSCEDTFVEGVSMLGTVIKIEINLL